MSAMVRLSRWSVTTALMIGAGLVTANPGATLRAQSPFRSHSRFQTAAQTPAPAQATAQTQTRTKTQVPPAGSPPAAVFSTRTDAVRLDVLVTRGDTPVSGLTAADFEVLDDGRPQQVRLLAQGEAPIDIVLALDTSGSMEGEPLTHLIAGVRALLAELRPGDRLGVLSFSQQVRLPIPLTSDSSAVDALLSGFTADGQTALNDAAWLALMTGEPDVRTLAIVFSDGLERSSWLSSAEVLDAGRRADAVVYGLVLDAGDSPPPSSPTSLGTPRPVQLLPDLAAATGGRVVTTRDARGLPALFRRVLAEFRQRYVLAFERQDHVAPGWHPLRVRVTSRRADVSARAGYFVAPPPARRR